MPLHIQHGGAEACIAILTTPFSGTQCLYVAIKHVVALYSQTPLNAWPDFFRVPTGSTAQEVTVLKQHGFSSATAESGKSLLKKPCLCLFLANRAHPRKCCYQTMLNSVLLCLGFLSFLRFYMDLIYCVGVPVYFEEGCLLVPCCSAPK